MLKSLERARGTTPAKKQSARGMQIFFENFTVDAVCIALPLCIKVLRLWATQDELEDFPFCYLYDKNYAFKKITFITSRLAPGQSARGLAALRYEELPAVRQVVRGAQSASWQSRSSQSDCEAGRSEEERAPTRKMAKDLKHEHSIRRPPAFLKRKAGS